MLSKSIVPQVVQLSKTVQYAATFNAALVTPVLSDLLAVLSHVVWRCGMYVELCSCRQLTLQLQTDCPGSCALVPYSPIVLVPGLLSEMSCIG